MAEVTNTLTSDASGATNGVSDAPSIDPRKRRWTIWGAVAVIVLGGLWFGLSRGGGPTVAATVADCTQSLGSPGNPSPVTDLQTGVVGVGSVASIATFNTPTGPLWCFDGMGVGSGGITKAELRSALSAPVAVEDGDSHERRTAARAPWHEDDVGGRNNRGRPLNRAGAKRRLRGTSDPNDGVADVALARSVAPPRRLARANNWV